MSATLELLNLAKQLRDVAAAKADKPEQMARTMRAVADRLAEIAVELKQ